jgi:hypothetical protein
MTVQGTRLLTTYEKQVRSRRLRIILWSIIAIIYSCLLFADLTGPKGSEKSYSPWLHATQAGLALIVIWMEIFRFKPKAGSGNLPIPVRH